EIVVINYEYSGHLSPSPAERGSRTNSCNKCLGRAQYLRTVRIRRGAPSRLYGLAGAVCILSVDFAFDANRIYLTMRLAGRAAATLSLAPAPYCTETLTTLLAPDDWLRLTTRPSRLIWMSSRPVCPIFWI